MSFFKKQERSVSFSKVTDRDGWDTQQTAPLFTLRGICSLSSSDLNVDAQTATPDATLKMFFKPSALTLLETIEVGDVVNFLGADYEIFLIDLRAVLPVTYSLRLEARREL